MLRTYADFNTDRNWRFQISLEPKRRLRSAGILIRVRRKYKLIPLPPDYCDAPLHQLPSFLEDASAFTSRKQLLDMTNCVF